MDYLYKALTSGMVDVLSGGKIPKMSHNQASGLIGSWIVETGKPGLEGLDVVERGNNNAGRGLSQYTGVRRDPYDVARADALAAGKDVQGAEWQLKYFIDEYVGRHDRGGNSMIGWTRIFENAPKQGTPAEFADYYTGSEAEARGYFRPGTPHLKQRMDAAMAVSEIYQRQKTAAVELKKPQPLPPSAGNTVTTYAPQQPVNKTLSKLNIPVLNQF